MTFHLDLCTANQEDGCGERLYKCPHYNALYRSCLIDLKNVNFSVE